MCGEGKERASDLVPLALSHGTEEIVQKLSGKAPRRTGVALPQVEDWNEEVVLLPYVVIWLCSETQL